jgi:hypothetical protein
MRKLTIPLFVSLVLISSCKIKSKPQPTKAEIEKVQMEMAENEANDDKEKIVLLSIIKQMPYDTLFSILRDYYFAVSNTNNDYQKAVFYTVSHHGFSEKKIASVIFSFEYEMMTRGDILEDEADENYVPVPDDN